MIEVSELPKADPSVYTDEYKSLIEAKEAMISDGTLLTQDLFFAATLIAQVNYGVRPDLNSASAFKLVRRLMLGGNVVVLRDNNEPIQIKAAGLYTTPTTSGDSEFRQLAVLPNAQGNGYGSAIANHVEVSIAEQGGRRVRVTPIDTAIPFYRKRGYVDDRYGMIKFLSRNQ